MSGDKIWCLVDGETRPFSVFDGDDPAKKKYLELGLWKDIVTSANIVPSQLDDPVLIEPMKSLTKRLWSPITDSLPSWKSLRVKCQMSFPDL